MVTTAQNKPVLVDRFGNPIVREALTQRLANATLTGVRQAVGSHAMRGLDPGRLASLLREAEDGDPEPYLQLAEEIEERDLHYLSVLGTRKRQVAQLDITIEAASVEPQDKDIADDVKAQIVDSGLIDGFLFDQLDAVGKGFSVGEIVWDPRGDKWSIDAIEFVDPRFIRFDRQTRRVPLLLSDLGQHLPLQPYKFVFTQIKAKSGIPIRGGMARPAAWAWMFKNFAIKDWVQFCDIYGIPFRLGKYAPGSTQADIDNLLRTVAAIAGDACGVIPNNMDITFQETKAAAGGEGVFGGLARFFDEQVSKAVLGQTGTTDATPGKLGGGNEHQQVREDIERADASALSSVWNRQIVRPYVDLNYGHLAADGSPRRYPVLTIGRPEPKDAALMVDTAAKLVVYGFRVKQADIRSATGFSEPQEGDELFTIPAAGAAAPAGNAIPPSDLKVDLNTRANLLAAELAPRDAIDRAADDEIAGWQATMCPMVDQILAAAKNADGSYDAFREELSILHTSLDTNPLAERLLRMTFQAFLGGVAGNTLGKH